MSGAVLPRPICLHSTHRNRFVLKGKSSNKIAEDSYSVMSHKLGVSLLAEKTFHLFLHVTFRVQFAF